MTGDRDPQHDLETYTRNVFDLALSCGHLVTVSIDGWYPVVVSCCERLGGTVWRGVYVPYASEVDYVPGLLSSETRQRPAETRREPTRILDRRPRTDAPCPPGCTGSSHSAGRFPARVGATWRMVGPDHTATLTAAAAF